jgi:hypothetical protein
MPRYADAERGASGLLVQTRDGAATDLETLEDLLEAALERNRQLEHALESRVVIEQAKGVLIERFRLDSPAAFALLRRGARNSRRKIHDLAAEVVASRTTPPELTRVLVELSPR